MHSGSSARCRSGRSATTTADHDARRSGIELQRSRTPRAPCAVVADALSRNDASTVTIAARRASSTPPWSGGIAPRFLPLGSPSSETSPGCESADGSTRDVARRKSARRRPLRCERMRVGVLASGSGTILRALLERGLPVAVVVVDRPCGAIEIATDARCRGRARRAHDVRPDVRSRRVHPRRDRRVAATRRRPRRDRRLRHDPVEAVRRRVRRTRGQHAPVAAAGVQGLARGARRARARREGHRLHRAPRHRRGRRRADPRPGGRAGARRRHRSDVARTHQGRSSARSTPTSSRGSRASE